MYVEYKIHGVLRYRSQCGWWMVGWVGFISRGLGEGGGEF